MAREKGIFQVSANYEPLKAAPFDARSLVESKADLLAAKTWVINGIAWVYAGMMVAVSRDIDPNNNGIYVLTDAQHWDQIESWRKQADILDIQNLQAQIDALEMGAGSLDIEVDSELDLPDQGDENTTYYVKDNASIQRWDAETESYVAYGGSGTDLDIQLINGGNAYGTD